MTPKEKAKDLINSYRIILMSEDTECGNEILCTSIAKQNALIAVNEIINAYVVWYKDSIPYEYWQQVKKEIEKL
jgi:hypothetical protein